MPFTAQTRMSGVDLAGEGSQPARELRKGAASAVAEWVREHGGAVPAETGQIVDGISASGGTPLVVGERIGSRPGCSASSTSRTSSRPACGSASTRCAGWASVP